MDKIKFSYGTNSVSYCAHWPLFNSQSWVSFDPLVSSDIYVFSLIFNFQINNYIICKTKSVIWDRLNKIICPIRKEVRGKYVKGFSTQCLSPPLIFSNPSLIVFAEMVPQTDGNLSIIMQLQFVLDLQLYSSLLRNNFLSVTKNLI